MTNTIDINKKYMTRAGERVYIVSINTSFSCKHPINGLIIAEDGGIQRGFWTMEGLAGKGSSHITSNDLVEISANTTSLEIKAGHTYKLRSGGTVYIRAIQPDATYPVIGHFTPSNSEGSWDLKGSYISAVKEHQFDLVEEVGEGSITARRHDGCECGASAVGHRIHSDWCKLYTGRYKT